MIGVDGTWQLDDQGWQKIDQVSAFVFEDSAGTLWFAGPNSEGLWRYNSDGWHQETQVTGIVNSIYQEPNGILWVFEQNGLWRYEADSFQPGPKVAGGLGSFYQDKVCQPT